MLAEVRLLIARNEIRLVLKQAEKMEEDELWKAERPISQSEATSLARACFDDWYDTMNYAVHGEDDG